MSRIFVCCADENRPTLARLVPADAGLCVEITDLAAHLDAFRVAHFIAACGHFRRSTNSYRTMQPPSRRWPTN